MSDEKFLKLMREKKRKIVIMHHNADLDCVSSALALCLSFPPLVLYAPLGVSSAGKRVLEKFGVEWKEKENLEDYDLIILLDTNSLEQVGDLDWERLKQRTIVVDHHDYNVKYEEALLYLWKPETSCAEIILSLLEKEGRSISSEVAEAILIGILGDTARFKFARNSTFKNLCKLIPLLSKDFSDILREVESYEKGGNLDRSRRIALLKGMFRGSYLDFQGVLISKSFVSSFEGDVAAALVSLAADLAVVGAQRGKEVRVSCRARSWLLDKGMNLAEICREIGKEFGGGGGGHPAAAGINAFGDVEAVVNAVIERIKEKLREIL